jgi:hypothetical protein
MQSQVDVNENLSCSPSVRFREVRRGRRSMSIGIAHHHVVIQNGVDMSGCPGLC